jgi:hypothetical protein
MNEIVVAFGIVMVVLAVFFLRKKASGKVSTHSSRDVKDTEIR